MPAAAAAPPYMELACCCCCCCCCSGALMGRPVCRSNGSLLPGWSPKARRWSRAACTSLLRTASSARADGHLGKPCARSGDQSIAGVPLLFGASHFLIMTTPPLPRPQRTRLTISTICCSKRASTAAGPWLAESAAAGAGGGGGGGSDAAAAAPAPGCACGRGGAERTACRMDSSCWVKASGVSPRQRSMRGLGARPRPAAHIGWGGGRGGA